MPGVAACGSTGRIVGGGAVLDVLRVELEHAREAVRVLDLLGRVNVLARYQGEQGPEIAREDAWYSGRALASAPGLVSVPTSDTRGPSPLRGRSARIAQAAAETLGSSLCAFQPDPDASRIARLRRAVGFTARVHCTAVDHSARCVMVTLTYRGTNEDWQPRHVSEFIKRVRQYLARRDVAFRYVWVAELQKRGVIHYHVALWLPAGVELPKPDECGWWPHGMTRIEVARGAVGYLMKYLSKGGCASDHRLPLGARCYGVGGLGAYWRSARRWLGLPAFVQARADVEGSRSWRRCPGGGWVDGSGEVWASEFRRVWVGGRAQLQRVIQYLPATVGPVAPSGVFSWLPGGA